MSPLSHLPPPPTHVSESRRRTSRSQRQSTSPVQLPSPCSPPPFTTSPPTPRQDLRRTTSFLRTFSNPGSIRPCSRQRERVVPVPLHLLPSSPKVTLSHEPSPSSHPSRSHVGTLTPSFPLFVVVPVRSVRTDLPRPDFPSSRHGLHCSVPSPPRRGSGRVTPCTPVPEPTYGRNGFRPPPPLPSAFPVPVPVSPSGPPPPLGSVLTSRPSLITPLLTTHGWRFPALHSTSLVTPVDLRLSPHISLKR